MDRQKPENDIIDRVVSDLETAIEGSQELDCMISYALELARGEFDQVMMELLVKEGFSWNVISEIWGGKVPPYTQSLDCGIAGENIAFAMRSDKRRQWAAVHKGPDGEEHLAWAKTEILARRLAALKGNVTLGRSERGEGTGKGAEDRETLDDDGDSERLRMVPGSNQVPAGNASAGHVAAGQAAAGHGVAGSARDGENWTVLF